MHPVLSVVIPVYNEEEVLPLLVERLRPVLDGTGQTYEVVAVDDGSKDASAVVLQRIRRAWPQLRIVRLRANAGHQAAISAGLARAHGDYMVTIDADLQDPPEVIAEMLAKAQNEKLDVVYGVRNDRSTDTAFKRGTAQAFYSTMRTLSKTDAPANAGDFRLMSRATVDAVNALPEHHRVLRLVVPQLGFPSGEVYYKRDERAAGESKYPLSKMIALSLDSLTSGSMAPLRLATWFGVIGFIGAVLIFVYALFSSLTGRAVAGWTSTVMAVAAVGAVQLVCTGILGEYVGRMYSMMQGRPTYFVAHDTDSLPHDEAHAHSLEQDRDFIAELDDTDIPASAAARRGATASVQVPVETRRSAPVDEADVTAAPERVHVAPDVPLDAPAEEHTEPAAEREQPLERRDIVDRTVTSDAAPASTAEEPVTRSESVPAEPVVIADEAESAPPREVSTETVPDVSIPTTLHTVDVRPLDAGDPAQAEAVVVATDRAESTDAVIVADTTVADDAPVTEGASAAVVTDDAETSADPVPTEPAPVSVPASPSRQGRHRRRQNRPAVPSIPVEDSADEPEIVVPHVRRVVPTPIEDESEITAVLPVADARPRLADTTAVPEVQVEDEDETWPEAAPEATSADEPVDELAAPVVEPAPLVTPPPTGSPVAAARPEPIVTSAFERTYNEAATGDVPGAAHGARRPAGRRGAASRPVGGLDADSRQAVRRTSAKSVTPGSDETGK